jgi:hypothetical protein
MDVAKIPYLKQVEDPKILSQLVKSLKADALLRTKINKFGAMYKFEIDLFQASSMQRVLSDTFEIDEPFKAEGMGGIKSDEKFRLTLMESLDKLFASLPFIGVVTGRDQKTVTVNIGTHKHIGKGDTLVIATVDDVQYHPLEQKVVDWRLTNTGRVLVDQVDEGMAFGTLLREEYGRQVSKNQKVVQIIPAPEAPATIQMDDLDRMRSDADQPPRLGWVGAGLSYLLYNRESSNTTQALVGTGGGFGFRGEAQLWFNSDWFSDLRMFYGGTSVMDTDSLTGAALSSYSMTTLQMKLSGGYHFHITPNFFGPKGWVKLSYMTAKYDILADGAEHFPVSASGLLIGFGGDIPIRQEVGALLNIEIGLLSSASMSGTFYGRSVSGVSVADIELGAYYWFQPKLKFKFSAEIKTHNLTTSTNSTISNKLISFGPSALFYF